MQPYYGNMSIKIPYARKKISSTLLLSLSAAIMLLLVSSPTLFFNPLLQPAQAQTTMNFRTTKPAITTDPNTGQKYTLTFDAQGTTSSSNPQSAKITSGTFKITYIENGSITSGDISHGEYSNSSSGASIVMASTVFIGQHRVDYAIVSACSTSIDNKIIVEIQGGIRPEYTGPVESSSSSSSSSSMTGTTTSQDSDGDGIPDSSDRCASNSNTRCYKESK